MNLLKLQINDLICRSRFRKFQRDVCLRTFALSRETEGRHFQSTESVVAQFDRVVKIKVAIPAQFALSKFCREICDGGASTQKERTCRKQ